MISKKFLEEHYLRLGKTYEQIEKEFGCSKDKLMYYMRKHDLKPRRSGRPTPNLVNQRFCKLVVKNQCPDGSGRWDCLCDCGNLTTATHTELKSGRQGCWDCRNESISKRKFGGHGDISGDKWDALKRSAKARNIEFSITIQYAWNLFLEQNRKCALTGVELSFCRSRHKKDGESTASLDRIDSNRGYIEGNVQWVHKDINWLKRDYSQSKFIELCRKVYLYALTKANKKGTDTSPKLVT